MGKSHKLPEEQWTYTDCECGCGEPVAQKRDDRKARFILGHQNRFKDWGAPEERFWAKVDRRGENECWPWVGANCGGPEKRGVIWFEGKRTKAPHVSLIISGLVHKDDLAWALHSCDNANCVNPNHLRWGTRKENHEDKVSRGRNSNATPTSREKVAISNLLTAGVDPVTLAEAFGFTPQQIMES